MAVVAVNTILDGAATKIDPAWCEHSHLGFIKGYKVISQALMLVFLHPFYWGFDKGRSPIVGTCNYRQVLGVRTFEVPPITDDILDWKL